MIISGNLSCQAFSCPPFFGVAALWLLVRRLACLLTEVAFLFDGQ